ncbi:MAG: PIG-L family deacetylase [Rhodothermales bacterium]|nr:PIG-L family deacetylase [Rhodothermales bacterium]
MAGLLLVIAHPDDEIFCSGLLAHLSSKGVPLHIVCLTRGEGGQIGVPPKATRETLPAVREREMARAAEVLGVESLVFLEYTDPAPDGSRLRAPDHDAARLEHDIAVQINKFDPDVVLTHGSTGDYGHPAHVLMHRMTKNAASKVGVVLYSFNAFFPGSGRMGALNRNDWATILVDGSPYQQTRFESFWEHETQWSVFVGELSSKEDYRSALQQYFIDTSVESYCRQVAGDASRDLMEEWCREIMIDPPAPNWFMRTRYSLIWTLRELARRIKRIIVR